MAQRIVIPGFRKIETSSGGEGGTSNYEDLTNKPSINNVPLVGKLKTVDLKLTDATLTEEGVPAEAKTVGSKLQSHTNTLNSLSESLQNAETSIEEIYDQIGDHTVKSDVPENAVFTDTVYDDTEVQKRISDNGYGEIAGGKNLLNKNKFVPNITIAQNGSLIKDNSYSLIYVPIKANVDYVFSRTLDSSGDSGVVWGISNILPSEGGTSSYNPVYPGTKKFSVKSNADGYFLIRDRFDKHEEGTGTNWQFEESLVVTEYEPYFPSNKMLAEEKADKSETTVNLLNPILKTTTSNGITCTNNGDGTYTLNGTKTTDTIWLRLGTVSLKANTSYKLIAQSPTYGTTDVRVYDNDGVYFGDGTYGGATPIITSTKDISVSMQIRIAEKTALDNFIIKPMITTNLDATYYDDFVQYTGDNGKLNSDVASLLKRIETLESLVNKTDTTVTE